MTDDGSRARAAAVPPGVIFVPPGAGRAYDMGGMRSVFVADGDETGDRYCVSEWWIDAHGPAVHPHAHEGNEELFYVLDGTMTFQMGDAFVDAPRGSFLRVPAGVTHGFENRTGQRAGVLNVFIPGGFEVMMPSIVAWHLAQQRADQRDA